MLVQFWFLAFLVGASLSLESNFYSEDSCSSKSGACVLENECPHPVNGEYRSLCKNQLPKGAVCCKNFPIEQLNCHQSHHDCRKPEKCAKHLNIGQRGCDQGDICCVLV